MGGHDDESHFLVEFLNGFHHALIVGSAGSKVAEFVFLSIEQLCKGGILSLYAKSLAQLGILDFHHGLVFPGIGTHGPSHQHLLGSEPAIGVFAVNLAHKVEGKGVQRHHTVVVDHLHRANLLGLCGTDGGDSLAGMDLEGQHRQQYDEQTAFAQQRMAQQPAELLAARQQHPYHGERQHQVAAIGDGNAPGVVFHGEDGAVVVGIERSLVEPVTVATENIIHRDDGFLGRVRLSHGNHRYEIGRRLGAGEIVDTETVEPQGERQPLHPIVRIQIEIVGSGPLAQMEHAFATGHKRSEGAGKDKQQRYMQHKNGQPPPQPLANQHYGRQHSQQSPQPDEPP